MAKTNKSNIKLPSLANVCGIEERLRRLTERDEDGGNFPVTEAFIQRISIEIMEWSEKPDSFLLSDFYNPRGYTDDKLLRWSNKYPTFSAAYEYAKDMLGARRERKKILEQNCDFTLGEYNKSWKKKEDLLHQRKLEIASKKDQTQPTTINIIQQKAEDCPEVSYAPKEISVNNDRSRDNDKA